MSCKEILEAERKKEMEFLKALDWKADLDLENPIKFHGTVKAVTGGIKSLGEKQWAVYLFFTSDKYSFDIEEYSKAKGNFQMARCPSDIESARKENKENCLYAGSSQNVKSRLVQHLTKKSKSVYALHLSEWLPEDEEITIEIIKMKGEDPQKMQKYEDYLWNHYRPLLGKQGRK